MQIWKGWPSRGSTCGHTACRYIAILIRGFASGTHTFACSTSHSRNFTVFQSDHVFDWHSCLVTDSDVDVWVTVDGIRSNVISW